ncbi:MAG: folate-binding protein [Microvirga sp.]
MPAAYLSDRGVVKVTGPDAKAFLDGIVTCDLDRVQAGAARLGALLSPQGKILFDFLVFEATEDAGGGYFLDVLKPYAPDLVRRLGFYKLRAKVAIDDRSDALALVAGWDDAPLPPDEAGLVARDARLPALGWRAVVAAEDVPEFTSVDAEAYHAHRLRLGVPEGGRDFLFGEAFPHEALMDQLHGVDFDKGCYIGQEVVSRMQHRGTARTRLVPARYEGGFAAEAGHEVTAGERTIGRTGSGAEGLGLVMIRLDRAADAVAAGQTIRGGGIALALEKPDWVSFDVPAAEAPASP